MADESIGDVITQPPEDGRVQRWKEFLSRPENLATALVLLAGVTSERRPGQSKLNKALQSGVGALGFRGGVERGVETSRRATREEERQAAAAAEDITASQARTTQGQEANRIAAQRVQQQGQARPLPQSEADRNTAAAELARAQATALGRDPDVIPKTFAELFARNKQLALENLLPGQELDLSTVALQTNRELLLMRVAEEGRFLPDGTLDLTDEEAAQLGIAVESEDVTPPEQTPSTGTTEDLRFAAPSATEALGLSTRSPSSSRRVTLNLMRRNEEFADLDETTILERVKEARTLAQDREALEQTQEQKLQELLSQFGRVLSPREKQNVRRALHRRTQLEAFRTTGRVPGGRQFQ